MSAVTPERIGRLASELHLIARDHRLAVGGAAAAGVDTAALGALALTDDPVREAERVTTLVLGP